MTFLSKLETLAGIKYVMISPFFLEKYFMILLFSRALLETTEFPSLKFARVLELCADPCRPRTCADHVIFIYFSIDFEIRTLRGPFMRGPIYCR